MILVLKYFPEANWLLSKLLYTDWSLVMGMNLNLWRSRH